VALEHQTTVKSWFQAGDAPTQGQFASWIETSMPEWHVDAAIQVGAGKTGVLDILSAVSATTHVPGSVGVQLLQTSTTAAADAILGITTSAGGLSFQRSEFGAVSRTMREKLSEPLSVRDFGAIGDGSTNDTAAFIAAFSAIDTTAASVYIPGGKYRLEGAVTASGRPFHIFGDGIGKSIMNWSSTASSQGFILKASTDPQDFMKVNDLTFFTAKSSAATVGLTLDYRAQIVVSGSTAGQERYRIGGLYPRFIVEDCLFTGVSGNFSGWNVGIENIVGDNGTVKSCHFIGWIEGLVVGQGARYPGNDCAIWNHGVGNSYENGHPVALHVIGNKVFYYKDGVKFDQCEGCYVVSNDFIACGNCVVFTGPTATPYAANPFMTVIGNDTDFYNAGVIATDAADIRVTDNEFIVRTESSVAALYGVMMRKTNADMVDSSIHHNSFVNFGSRPYIGVRTEGARTVSIGANSFRGTTTGIELGANAGGVASQACVVEDSNTFSGVTTKFSVTSAAGNYIANVSAGANGMMNLSNGMQFRMGTQNAGTSAGNSTINWERNFTSSCLGVVISNGNGAAVSRQSIFNVEGFTTGGFTFSLVSADSGGRITTTVTLNFLAWGI